MAKFSFKNNYLTFNGWVNQQIIGTAISKNLHLYIPIFLWLMLQVIFLKPDYLNSSLDLDMLKCFLFWP